MFTRRVDDDIALALNHPCYSDQVYALVDTHRASLRQWLPWVDSSTQADDTREFSRQALLDFAEGKAMTCVILFRGEVAGLVGYNQLRQDVKVGEVGYWLAPSVQGQGIMTRAVAELVRIGFECFDLRKVQIRCATGNHKSQAIPMRLGFTEEGILRNNECVNGRYLDHRVFGLLREEFAHSPCAR